MSKQGSYGFPCVSNPNDFIPDTESSTPAEIETHRIACANWGKPAFEPNKGCFTEYDDKGQMVLHVTRTSWGIGTNLMDTCDGCNTPTFGDPLIACHECGGPEFCEHCWPEHERKHDEEG